MRLRIGSVPVVLVLAVLVISGMGMLGAIQTELINQAQAQGLAVTEDKKYVSDINVHFKTACISVIIFTYCW